MKEMCEETEPTVWEFEGARDVSTVKELSRRSISNKEILPEEFIGKKLDTPSTFIYTTSLASPPAEPLPENAMLTKRDASSSVHAGPTRPPLPLNPPPLPPGPPPMMHIGTDPLYNGHASVILARASSFSSPLVSRRAAPLPEGIPKVPKAPAAVSAFKKSPTHGPQLALERFFDVATNAEAQREKTRRVPRQRGMSLSGQHSRRSLDSYAKMDQIGGGAYGDVFKARDKETGEVVALKKVRLENEKEGFPVTALREIKFLFQAHHANIVSLKEVVTSRASESTRNKGSVFMVFEYAESDLVGLMKTKQLREDHIMCILKQLLEALYFAHTNHVLHRDIKPSNVLVTRKGAVKLADWGLCRKRVDGRLTNRVVTLWYRAPEVLLGTQNYSSAIDMWAVGCLMGELLVGKPILPGKDDMNQLHKIFELCGTPRPDEMPEGWDSLPLAREFFRNNSHESDMNLRFAHLQPLARDLIGQMLCLDPKKRITAQNALDHDYFWQEDQRPCLPENLPTPTGDGLHEYQLREEEKRQVAAARAAPRG